MALVEYNDTEVHQRYFNSRGQVPGSTTVNSKLGLNKRVLMNWAHRMGQDGIDINKFTGKAADIGTCAHFMVECHLKGDTPGLGNFSQNDIEKATNAYNAYLEWEQQFKSFEFVYSELQLASEVWDYGGTLDIIVKINDILTLVDLKTSKDVYADHIIQVVSYKELYNEVMNCKLDKDGIPVGPVKSAYKVLYEKEPDFFKQYYGTKIDQIWILKINKENGRFKNHKVDEKEDEKGWEVFKAAHDIYWDCKEMGW